MVTKRQKIQKIKKNGFFSNCSHLNKIVLAAAAESIWYLDVNLKYIFPTCHFFFKTHPVASWDSPSFDHLVLNSDWKSALSPSKPSNLPSPSPICFGRWSKETGTIGPCFLPSVERHLNKPAIDSVHQEREWVNGTESRGPFWTT